MIVFDLECRAQGHRFEGWFGSSSEFDRQCARGLVSCPECGSLNVGKAVMAPLVGRKGNQLPVPAKQAAKPQPVANAEMPPEAAAMMQTLAKMQAEALSKSKWVGGDFTEQSRAMHYGEREHEVIHGQATLAEAKELHEEGVPVMPLPFPVAPPDETN
jgi:hypothetical protein